MSRYTNVPVLHSWKPRTTMRSPQVQLKVGSVIGYAKIKDVLTLFTPEFLKDLRIALTLYIGHYFPRRKEVASNVVAKTAGMADDAIASITVTKNAVRLSSAGTWEVRKRRGGGFELKRYAKYVQQMANKQWSNPETIEHPYSALLVRMRIEMVACYLRIAQLYGLI